MGTITSQADGDQRRRSATTPMPASTSSSPGQVKNQDSRSRFISSYERV